MKPRDYCCCAIPTVNAGVYAVLVEHFVLALVVGTLAVAAPSIVGAESFTSWPLAIICYANAAIQIFGFMGVARDNNIIFRRYITLHILTSVGAFAVSGAMIGMSAGRHNTAQNDCIEDFFSSNSTSTTGSATSSLGNTLCNIFPWVDVGVMGGLWILLALSQIYFYTVISGYGVWQREPRDKYDSVTEYSGLAGDIPMANRSDPWDSHAPDDRLAGYNGQHARTGSAGVRLDEPYTDAPHEPTVAHTQYGAPTPAMQEPVHFQSRGYEGPYYSGSTTGISRPEQYQPHPG